MTATEQTTKKWTAGADLGKIQAKRFNEAISRFKWQAKTVKEITDFGEHCVTPMFVGPTHPETSALMYAITAFGAFLGSRAAILNDRRGRHVLDCRLQVRNDGLIVLARHGPIVFGRSRRNRSARKRNGPKRHASRP